MFVQCFVYSLGVLLSTETQKQFFTKEDGQNIGNRIIGISTRSM